MGLWRPFSLSVVVAMVAGGAAGSAAGPAEQSPRAGPEPFRPGHLVRLTDDPADEVEPKWSPDGRLLSFASNRSGNWDLWVVDLATGEESPLVTHEAFDHSPRWSPDGARIAFHSARSGNGDIWLLDLEPGFQKGCSP